MRALLLFLNKIEILVIQGYKRNNLIFLMRDIYGTKHLSKAKKVKVIEWRQIDRNFSEKVLFSTIYLRKVFSCQYLGINCKSFFN